MIKIDRSKMKVCFIGTWGQPLGIAYIAAVLEKEGYICKIMDLSGSKYDLGELQKILLNEKPDIVGISSITPTFPEALQIARATKAKLPETIVVMGGIHTTVRPHDALNTPYVNIVVRGEGEITFKELLQKISQGKSIDKILGISFKNEEEIIHNESRPPIEDLDSLPFPAWHLMPLEKYRYGFWKEPFVNILTSRGCKGVCTYCIHSKKTIGKFRARSAKNVVDEIEHIKEKFGIRFFRIIDDNFTYDKERVLKICDLIQERELNIIWDLPNGTRVDTVDKELLQKMYDAGCFKIDFGIESGNQEILKKMRKNITKDQVRKTVRDAKEVGLSVGGFFMLGNIGENEQTLKETIEFAKELNCDHTAFSIATPYPGTVFWDKVEKDGCLLYGTDWSRYRIYEQPIFEMGDLTADLLFKYLKKAHRKYYLRQKFLVSSLKHIFMPKSRAQFLYDIDTFIQFVKVKLSRKNNE